jgi:hypothetical protein
VDRRRPINGELQQDAGRDIEWRARRKKHRDGVKCDLSVIREIAEVGADRRSEICRSELADQRSERPHFTGCHQALPSFGLAHKFTRANCFNDLSAVLRNFFRRLGESTRPAIARRATVRFGFGRAQTRENERIHFAKRNEAFRLAGHKSLKSLRAANHDFTGSFVFNGLSAVSFRRFLACGWRRLKS